MSCRNLRPDIALYVENDLAPQRLRNIETHLAACPECRAFADELRESQSVIRQVRNEIVDAASLNRIRAKVLDRVQQIETERTWLDRAGIRLWTVFRLRYALLGSMAAVLVAVGVWQVSYRRIHETIPVSESRPVPTVGGAGFTPAQPGDSSAPQKATFRPPRRPKVGAHRTAKLQNVQPPETPDVSDSRPEDVVVKILTDDPNVVIYWLVDPKTGGF